MPLFSVPRASWHLWPAALQLGAQGLWFNMARLRNTGYFNIYPQFLLCGTHHMAPSSFSASGVRLGHNKLLGRGVRQSHQPAMRQGQPPLLGSLLTAPCAGFLRQGNQTPLARPGSLKQSLFVPGSNRYSSLALFSCCNPAAFHTRCCLLRKPWHRPWVHPSGPRLLLCGYCWGLKLLSGQTAVKYQLSTVATGGLYPLSKHTGAPQLKSVFLLYFTINFPVLFGIIYAAPIP